MNIHKRGYEMGDYTVTLEGIKVPVEALLDNGINIAGFIVEVGEFDPTSAKDTLRAIKESREAMHRLQLAAARIEYARKLR